MSYSSIDDWAPSGGISLDNHAIGVVRATSSCSILAGPGAGKTELLAQRANFLLTTGVCSYPKRILALAFKVDAARNLRERVAARCDAFEAARFESLTLHAFAKRTLDQFLEALPAGMRPTSDYRIFSPDEGVWDEFRSAVSGKNPQVLAYGKDALHKIVHSDPSGELLPTSNDGIREAWWIFCLRRRGPSILTFEMVLRLAVTTIETQPLVRAALRETYTHVFLDEFQDVNELQYRFIKSVFGGSHSIMTAVGDTNQAIMAWAGALPDIFRRFNADFAAQNTKLLLNFRSNQTIVKLINNLATMFEAEPVPAHAARTNDPIPKDALEAWVFINRASEAKYISDFIRQEILNEHRKPEDFVILARLGVGNIEKRLQSSFASSGLFLRNESRKIGNIEIQDLVKEKAFQFVLSIIKMTKDVREGNPFQYCRDTVAEMIGEDITTERGSSYALRAVQKLVADLTSLVGGREVSQLSGNEIAEAVFTQQVQAQFAAAFNEYRSSAYLSDVITAFCSFFDECAKRADSWKGCIDRIEGRGVTKLMTIHKSKGLEFHTVIFVELNDDAFWKSSDDANVFLVALSRARERIKFCFAKDSAGFKNVQLFMQRLTEAGVTFENRP